MAEARSEEEEESLRENREQVVRRQSSNSGGRPNRRKPEHRLSQGPLSSIRAAFRRTSNRSSSVSETSRDRDRDRRRPQITILSAEPLTSTSWFPGPPGGVVGDFPPPPPPAAQIWGPTIPAALQPPPSYEEVIREKTQEQVLPPPPSSFPSCSNFTTTIATQTEPGSVPDPEVHVVTRRPVRPPRPPFPNPTSSSQVDDITNQSTSTSLSLEDVLETNVVFVDSVTPPPAQLVCPRPQPRSKLSQNSSKKEAKVQTLVKLREDSLATLAARAEANAANQQICQGKYLQELLDAFSADDWGFPEHRRDSSQSESEEEEDEEEEEEGDMAALKARIQAFEQQKGADDGSSSDIASEKNVTKQPEPRPRPRLQPAKSAPPVVAPKPKTFAQAPKQSTKVLCEDGSLTDTAVDSVDTVTAPIRTMEKPCIAPKPQLAVETLPPTVSAPVPAPRPPPPKLCPSSTSPKPPPRPAVAPRGITVAPQQEKSSRQNTPTLPPRPSVEVGISPLKTESSVTDTQETVSVKESVRPDVPTKPSTVTPARRASAPNLDSTSDKPAAVASRPPGSAAAVAPVKPPAPALRRNTTSLTKAESFNGADTNSSDPPLPHRPSSVKLLPLRPPPIKAIPERPPPPAVTSSPHSSPAPNMSPASQGYPAQGPPPPSEAANQKQAQRQLKKGPPLPPRPKPGHPLYKSCMKQEVLIVLDNPSPPPPPPPPPVPSEPQPPVGLVISTSQCLLDMDIQPEPESKPNLEELSLSETQSILPVQQPQHKEQDAPVSGPRCVALFDYEGEEEDELTFSQGDIISLLELMGTEWGRGQIHGKTGIFPLNFTDVTEPLPQPVTSAVETRTTDSETETTEDSKSQDEEWAVALFDFPGQTAEDLSFHKGALIRVTEHVNAEWRRGIVNGREGLYPAAFTQHYDAQPITEQQNQQVAVKQAKVMFDFVAENEDELTLKVGDIITEVESVDEQWIVGAVGGKRGIAPKNYISLL